jgi:hypothetical protein
MPLWRLNPFRFCFFDPGMLVEWVEVLRGRRNLLGDIADDDRVGLHVFCFAGFCDESA